MSVDKNYCMSSYLAFRYIERDDVDFYEHMHHKPFYIPDGDELVSCADDIDKGLHRVFSQIKAKRIGLLLSGGMDSSILATYMPKGSMAYTFRFLGGEYEKAELRRAETFARLCELNLQYVDIEWDSINSVLPMLMTNKCAPVHSIEPQLFLAANQAKKDGIDTLVIGDAADYVFYGMDGLLKEDWLFDDFVKRATYIMPNEVLKDPYDITYLYEKYRKGKYIDYLGFYDKSITEESYGSYSNAFETAKIDYVDPYEKFRLKDALDLKRTRSGDSKYYIRELFRKKYPQIELPEKHPMPRPVDEYFKEWDGPKRPEFRNDINITNYTGNQKWLLWCLERFLNIEEPL